jgi:spore germination cell wall hydrolase CwlJ-like protein
LSAWLTYAKRDFGTVGNLESKGSSIIGFGILERYKGLQRRRFEELNSLEIPVQPKSQLRDLVPMAFAGVMLVTAFAFAGHYIGRNADAHNATVEDNIPLVMPTSALATKGSLLPEGETFALLNLKTLRSQTVLIDGKGDLAIENLVEPVPVPVPLPKPKVVKLAKVEKEVKIIPASVDLKHPDEPAPAVKRMAVVPAQPDVQKTFKLEKAVKQKVVAQRRVRLAEENCLARAVYFESRSESDLGQLAVAKVILNRVKSPDYPKSICGVVYQGSGTRNSCQFSFACDGLPDDVNQPGAWSHAKTIAQRAISGDPAIAMMGSATNYHADYVKPRWAKAMRRLARIGHHIFYAGG